MFVYILCIVDILIYCILSLTSLSLHSYNRLFEWLVERLNAALAATDASARRNFIGILDIYGFEARYLRRSSPSSFG